MADVCRSLVLGSHGSIPETMVKWEGSPILYSIALSMKL